MNRNSQQIWLREASRPLRKTRRMEYAVKPVRITFNFDEETWAEYTRVYTEKEIRAILETEALGQLSKAVAMARARVTGESTYDIGFGEEDVRG